MELDADGIPVVPPKSYTADDLLGHIVDRIRMRTGDGWMMPYAEAKASIRAALLAADLGDGAEVDGHQVVVDIMREVERCDGIDLSADGSLSLNIYAFKIISSALRAAEARGRDGGGDAPKWTPTHRHYKGGLYRVIAAGKIESDQTDCVIYQDRDGSTWVRPEADFDAVLPDGRRRFEPLPPAPGGA